MLAYFSRFIKEKELLAPGEKVLAGVSGGVDSMVLCDLLLKANINFGVAHVNYQLRGADSEKDEELVRDWCKKNKIKFHLTIVPRNLFDSPDSLQMVAREFRYAYFQDLANEHRYHKVATAHHLDDSIETTLLNLTKGTALRGLTGISPQHHHLIRPLLFADKEEILEYARDHQIQWREDVSNQKNDYQRNILRNKVIPILKEINPGLSSTFHRSLQRLNDNYELINSRVEAIKKQYITKKNGYLVLALDWMNEEAAPWSLLSELLRTYGFSYFQVDDLLGSIQSGASGKIFISDSHELNLDRAKLVIRRLSDQSEVYELLEVPGTSRFGAYSVYSQLINGTQLPGKTTRNIAYLDYDKLGQKLKIRNWRSGDFFYPLGMKGKKKISDYMIDSKIPLSLKKDVLIMEAEAGIAWVVGWRIDERFKVSVNTRQMIRIEILQDV